MSEIMRAVLADPTGQIERECAEKCFRRKDVALTYALAIRDESVVPVDWSRVNKAIRERWSPAGLEWIKKRAWHLVDGARAASSSGGSPGKAN